MLGARYSMLVKGDEELAAFCVEDGGDMLDAPAFAEATADKRCSILDAGGS